MPFITSFAPGSGAVGGSVTVRGANFVSVNTVKFNGVSATTLTVESPSQITATVPTGATSGPISVTTANGTGQSAASFTIIPAPVIADFTPNTGSAGTLVTVTGNNFAAATAVTFNGLNAASFSVASIAQVIATAPAGVTTGPIRVTTPGGTAVSAGVFTALAAPGNDNFGFAQVITGNSGTVSGSNVAATKETGEPDHASNDGGKSIWYRWIAPGSGTWTFNTVGSGLDTLLAVYTGTSLGGLVGVGSNDNIPGTNTSSISFSAAAGTTYQIAVDGFRGEAGEGGNEHPAASGTVILNWNLSANFAPQITSFSPSSGSAGNVVTINGVNFSGATGVTFNGLNAVFTIGSDVQISAIVPAGATTGPIQVVKPSGTATSASSFAVSTAPGNDNFVNARLIEGSAGTVTGSNAGATKEPGEPNHAGNGGGSSVWYTWTAPSSGAWRLDTAGSSFDTLLAVYTGTGVAALSLVASNDDSGLGVTSQLTFNATGGTTYYFAADGYGGVTGSVTLNWAFTGNLPSISGFSPPSGGLGTAVTIAGANLGGANAVRFGGVSAALFTVNSSTQVVATLPTGVVSGPISITTSNGTAQSAASFLVKGNAPDNDNFANPALLTGAAKTVTGANVGATREANEPYHAGNAGGASVWWTWTAPSSGSYTLTTRGSSFDTVLGVYTGASLPTLTPLVSNDDGPNMGTASQVSFSAIAGVAYQVAVDGYNGATGNIVLSVYPALPPQDVYFTGFDLPEGYSTSLPLAGQKGWVSYGVGQNGVVDNFFNDLTQQAYVGFNSTIPGTNLFVWQPLNFTPNTNTRPVVVFSTFMEIVDSSNSHYDDFGWDVFNGDGTELFFLDFDNNNLKIYYALNDGTGYHDTGQTFQNGQVYYLEVTMDFARNIWAATLNGANVVLGQPVSARSTIPLNLGDIDATWLQAGGSFGNNFMLFDNYYVRTAPSQIPRVITAPQDLSVRVGDSARFLVVVDSTLGLSYQWRFNGANIPGANGQVLDLSHIAFGQAGSYSVMVTNTAGAVISGPAVLTVNDLPNLVGFKPAGWSDKVVAATSPGTNDATVIYSSDEVYISWAVLNASTNGNIAGRFYSQLYLDGLLKQTWFNDGLKADFYAFVLNYDVGKLSAGTHTLRLDSDTTSVVAESNENDNSYTKSITVVSTNNAPPRLGAPFLSADGHFQFTLTGTPQSRYELQASIDLTNWSTLATLVNSNGLFQYSDPTATNFGRRFYRGHWIRFRPGQACRMNSQPGRPRYVAKASSPVSSGRVPLACSW